MELQRIPPVLDEEATISQLGRLQVSAAPFDSLNGDLEVLQNPSSALHRCGECTASAADSYPGRATHATRRVDITIGPSSPSADYPIQKEQTLGVSKR